MPFDREAAWSALFTLLQSKLGTGDTPTFTTIGRTHVRPPLLFAELQPAAFLVQARETRRPTPAGTGGKLTSMGFLIVYFQAPEPLLENIGQDTLCGGTQLNALLLAIDNALLPDDVVSRKLTLGGLVDHCWIEGEVDLDPGIYTAQGAAIFPIKMTEPA